MQISVFFFFFLLSPYYQTQKKECRKEVAASCQWNFLSLSFATIFIFIFLPIGV